MDGSPPLLVRRQERFGMSAQNLHGAHCREVAFPHHPVPGELADGPQLVWSPLSTEVIMGRLAGLRRGIEVEKGRPTEQIPVR
jgi:hypothetical protein